MADPGITSILFRKGSTVFTVHPYASVTQGVYLAEKQVDGIYDAPVKTTYKTGAFQDGSRQRAHKKMQRDMTLGFHIRETTTTYEFNESEFRRMFDYELDPWSVAPLVTTLEVTTLLSGTRKLDVLMYEEPEFDADRDPIQDQYGNLLLKLRAAQPMWYEDDVISSVTGGTSGSGDVTVSNPTDQIMRQKWVLTKGTWSLPDRSWTGNPGARAPGGAFSSRNITGITVTTANGGAVVDLDRQELMFRDANDTNILAQLPGKIFAFPIPTYTQSRTLPVSWSAGTASTTVSLVQPRRWSRPWGLEL